jgi:hypothetical protein
MKKRQEKLEEKEEEKVTVKSRGILRRNHRRTPLRRNV